MWSTKQKMMSDVFILSVCFRVEFYSDRRYEYVERLCAERGIFFEDDTEWYDTIGINFDEDFFDFSHLNYVGSCKYTEHIGNGLKYRFDLPDHRGDERYESWDRNVLEIQKKVDEAGW